jgi:superfamily II DNA or RNA helicase
MQVIIGENIEVRNATEEIRKWCKDNLILSNPDYTKKARMGFWVGNTPRTISLYTIRGNDLILPFGLCRKILSMSKGAVISTTFRDKVDVNYQKAHIPLYDYQLDAVKGVLEKQYGILQAPAGCGKTQMGIALCVMMGRRALWLTHTKDLLNQSKSRAEQYINPELLGTITEGKVNIGECITFATIQTMCNVDLDTVKDEWDVIVTDECHRVAGSPTAVTQFSKVLNALRARHKYGLSATVHRADGLIKATYALLGEVVYKVPDEDVAGRIMKVEVSPRGTGIGLSYDYLNSDGTINYAKMITYLAENKERNEQIAGDLVDNADHYNLILSERVIHLKTLYDMLPSKLRAQAAVIDGKMTSKAAKEEREQAIEDMRTGKKRYLFATYQLCKEGLDIPRLDRLYLATPQKDYAVITQSVGRVARTFEGKDQPVVYDYVDNTKGLIKSYKLRCTTYRKAGCRIMEEP